MKSLQEIRSDAADRIYEGEHTFLNKSLIPPPYCIYSISNFAVSEIYAWLE